MCKCARTDLCEGRSAKAGPATTKRVDPGELWRNLPKNAAARPPSKDRPSASINSVVSTDNAPIDSENLQRIVTKPRARSDRVSAISSPNTETFLPRHVFLTPWRVGMQYC